jgi:hypothetical protein
MLSHFRPMHSSKNWRPAYAVCILLAISYIFFDVLDLDGSNFSRLLAPVERSVIVAEPSSPSEFFDLSEMAAHHWIHVADRFIDRFEEFNFLRQARAINLSILISARAHRYRVTLARYSLPNSSPYL